MPFSAFALAMDRFVTIGRRTAQFCFGLLMRCLFWAPSLAPKLLTWQLCGSDCVSPGVQYHPVKNNSKFKTG